MSAIMQSPDVLVRDMTRADLNDVYALEIESYPFPWSVGIFGDCLSAGYKCTVAMNSTELIGYTVLALAADEAHILNLCVAPKWRQRRIGSLMVNEILRQAHELNVQRLYLEVRPSNVAALQLYTGAGFEQVGIRKDYYPGKHGREDALVLSLSITGSN